LGRVPTELGSCGKKVIIMHGSCVAFGGSWDPGRGTNRPPIGKNGFWLSVPFLYIDLFSVLITFSEVIYPCEHDSYVRGSWRVCEVNDNTHG